MPRRALFGAAVPATAEQEPENLVAASRDMRPVVICGFGELGQSLVNMLESPLSQTLERGPVPYVAFDLQPARIKAARAAGFNVLYGDASRYSCCAVLCTCHDSMQGLLCRV